MLGVASLGAIRRAGRGPLVRPEHNRHIATAVATGRASARAYDDVTRRMLAADLVARPDQRELRAPRIAATSARMEVAKATKAARAKIL